MKNTTFKAYRYQLLPLDRNQTKDLYKENLTTEEIISKKNYFFKESIFSFFKSNKSTNEFNFIIYKLTDDFFKFTLSKNRPLHIETKDLKHEKIENWPSVEGYILNDKDDQILIVQERFAAFSKTDVVVNYIKKETRNLLENFGLSLHIEAMYDKNFFWEMANRYKNRITRIEFKFITPNMAAISQALGEDLRALGKSTNSTTERLILSSDQASSLDVTEENQGIKGLVDYTSKGAGSVSFKARGVTKTIKTADSVKEVSLTDIEIHASPEDLIAIIKEALK